MTTSRTPKQRALLLLGSIGPLGHLPASGTATVAIAGIPLFWLMHGWSLEAYSGATLAFCAVSIWVHQIGDRILGEKDSRRLVWDELVGYMIAVAHLPFTWQIAVLAFLVERTLDITKIPPARQIENTWPGGWGVVGDDVVAGLYTCAVMQLLIRLVPAQLGMGT